MSVALGCVLLSSNADLITHPHPRHHSKLWLTPFVISVPSRHRLSAQVILRGTRSAGYGFVAFKTAEAAEKSVSLLNKKELDGREVIVEVAKPAEIKEKERTERRATKKAGRRGAKAPTGEVTEAEANGEAKADETKPEGTAKPKKKKAPVSLR